MRVLFVLKLNVAYGYGRSASGLLNSAQFIVDMLNANKQTAKLVQVVDNNDIDREVAAFRPDVAVIEALWVVPEKFAVLIKLHPKVKWIVRGHSNLPFLAQEGIAIDWLTRYVQFPQVSIAFNSPKVVEDFQKILTDPAQVGRVIYLPNYYPLDFTSSTPSSDSAYRVGCFGAIRPLKNQLLQAFAAVRFARQTGRRLEFHINSTRVEEGDGILKNLRALFAFTGYKLVEHPWMTRPVFLKLMATMDVALAVSLSETFCITAADAVSSGVPLICSDEIPWASAFSIVPATDEDELIERLGEGMISVKLAGVANRRNLRAYSKAAQKIWLRFLK